MSAVAIQDELFPDTNCYGCGPRNSAGLQLKSYRVGDRIEASFTARPEHDNAFGFLNGGIIATLLDCHSAAAVFLEAARQRTETGGEVMPTFLTAGIDIRYLRPSPLAQPLLLIAALVSATEEQVVVSTELVFDDKPRATGLATWKRYRPRGMS